MTEQEQVTVVGAVADVSKSLIGALPVQFLVLVLLNIAFLGTVLWFEEHQMEARLTLVSKVIDSCIKEMERSP